MEHWFWLGLVAVTLIWYVVVTGFVAWRGASDIKRMLDEFTPRKR